MKILFVSLFLPQKRSRHAGGRYVFEILNNLAQRHEIHLATRLEEEDLMLLETLKPLCKTIHPYTYRTVAKRGLADNLRLIGNYLGFSRYADRLIRAGEYDLVQVEWVETALLIRKGKTPMVLDAHDVITKPAEREMRQKRGLKRFPAWLKYVMVRLIERRVMRRFNVILTLSEFDRNYLHTMAAELTVQTVPIPAGLDITDRTFEVRQDTILFVASFRYRRVNAEAALWFYCEVFARVRARVPAARFMIAGDGPPEELTSLAKRDPQVEVTGFVEDLDRVYKEAAVFVAPTLVGGGIIVKILDAMAAGAPVVTTTYGNEGIGAVPGRDILIADSPDLYAEAVVNVLSDRGYAERIAENGREYIRKHFGKEGVFARLESIYRQLKAR